MGSARPAFVMLEPAPHACAGCEAMGTFWSMVEQHYPQTCWRVNCADSPQLCQTVGTFDAQATTEPNFASWSGTQFVPYAGVRNPQGLLDFVRAEFAHATTRAQDTDRGVCQPGTEGCAADAVSQEEEDAGKYKLLDLGQGYRRCVLVGSPDSDGRRAGAEEVGLSVLVLDGSYSHPVSKATMLTPQLRISLRNWAGAGLLSQPLVRERLIFIQELRAQHCDMLDGQHFRVVGNAANVGIPTAQNYLMREASSSHVLFLERDYVTVDPRPVVEEHVRFALEMLRGPRMHNRGAVLLRAQEQSGVSEEQTRRLRSQGLVCQARGSSLSTNVCENQTTLRAAFATDFATDFTPTTTGGVGFEPTTSGAVAAAAGGGAWRFEAELCQAHAPHRWDPPGLFYTTLSAMESCSERLLAAQDELRRRRRRPSPHRRCPAVVSILRNLRTTHTPNRSPAAVPSPPLSASVPRTPTGAAAPTLSPGPFTRRRFGRTSRTAPTRG